MTTEYTLSLDDSRATLAVAGGKGASLARLVAAGLPVPGGFHVTTGAYRQFVDQNGLQPRILAALESADPDQPATLEAASQAIRELFSQAEMPPAIAGAVARAYASLAGERPTVAVRSSATAEDLPGLSFAGQQETYLNVRGADAVIEAVKRCWASLWTARAIGYRARHDVDQRAVSLAVVVQRLVPAEAAGIMFTANPVTGARAQATISAAWGLGEAVVGGLVTPDTLTADKATGQVLTRETASKQVMTVRVAGGTQEQPVPEELIDAPVLDDAQAAELAQLGVQIEELYGMPMDVEWALADGRFAIVQARPITALPEPELPVPAEWPMPNPKGQYMRASIIDLMPDPLSPLFATMGLPAINRGIGTMCKDMFNLPVDTFSNLTMTINGYAYQGVSFSCSQWFLMLTRMVPAFPRMLRQGVPYWRDVAHPRYTETAERWRDESLPDLSPAELLSGVHELLDAFAHHLGSLMASTMGPSSGSELLFTKVYEKMARQEGDPPAPAFLMGYDSIPIKGEKALFDLALWCRERKPLAAYLAHTPTQQLVAQLDHLDHPEQDQALANVPAADWHEWQARFRDYLARYGYSIYDMDFAKPLPMDEPAPLLEMLKLFITGQGKSPHERQGAYAKRREEAVKAARARLKGLKRWAFEKTLKWAQSQAPLREDGIAEVGLAYPVLRQLLRELGRRFALAGAIGQPDDVFWLEGAEVEALTEALERGEALDSQAESVQERKAVWKARKRATPPPQLPMGKKYMGFDVEAMLSGGEGGLEGNAIKGVATSPGRVTATARVLHGPEDFDQMQPGDVLVAGITTPAWTPLFAMAAGVVTDVGGPLSHGSIVAREYGIPAVMGTGIATRRIRSGQTITVDGGEGTIVLAE
jgi:phosphohistidine swiveling domain-containing protein